MNTNEEFFGTLFSRAYRGSAAGASCGARVTVINTGNVEAGRSVLSSASASRASISWTRRLTRIEDDG